MRTENKIKKSISFIALSAIMMLGTNVYGQVETRRAASSLTADSAKDERIKNAVINDVEKTYTGFCKHEFLVWLGGGYSTLNYSPTFGDRDYRFGGVLGLGYGYHFNPHWSINGGLEIGLYNMKMAVKDLTDSYSIKDADGDAISYYSEIDQYTEKQRLYTLNIPVWLQYQTPINDNGHEFFAALGVKLGIPISAKYHSNDAQFVTYGYYEKWNQTFYDQRDLGYGDNEGDKINEKLNLNLSFMGTADVGIKWQFGNPKYKLYTGVYFDLGFNDLLKKQGNKFLDYNYQNPENFSTINSVLTSEYTQYGNTQNFMNRISTIALGLKVRLGINTCSVPQAKRPPVYDTRDKDEINELAKERGYRDGYKDAMSGNNPQPKDDNNIAYSKGYLVGYKDGLAERQSLKPVENTPVTERRNAPAPVRQKPTYESDPLLAAELKRASSEYGKITDVITLAVDGYEVNQSKLSPVMERMIDERIKALQKYNNDKYLIIIEGHTCDLGREEFNLNLGQKRAEVLREYLMQKGFSGDNLIATSKGESTPIVPNDSEANRKMNRRIVFLVKEKK